MEMLRSRPIALALFLFLGKTAGSMPKLTANQAFSAHAITARPAGSVDKIPGFDIDPNPTEGAFSLDLSAFPGKKVAVAVSNVFGKTVFSGMMNAAEEPTFDIDLSGQPGGVYFVKIEAEGQRAMVKRLIISKLQIP